MIIVHTIQEIRKYVREQRAKGHTIGFVPTMGYLHDGHLSLLRAAKAQCETVVMSIFVNPLQFGPNEDFERYPRDLERDAKMAEQAGCHIIFAPDVNEMYPRSKGSVLTRVEVDEVTVQLCGASRPGHFRGVATVVSKLFNIVQPDQAFFGMKDAQQVAVLQTMVDDLNIPVEIVPCPILREVDGLAMSSRNVFLSADERQQALVLHASLQMAERMVADGVRDVVQLKQAIREQIQTAPLADIDYVEILNFRDLSPIMTIDQPALLALAVRFGQTRLIDNIVLKIR
ncbi:pantoate--beta-alanine ligase [Tumebacillus algifaecis]|uniref:Pantothenate synthetase n=1 Tax=Tumebacillus algifaecis TaxID=1214604 RepID=A0A223D1K7_9BACL|nr:pantoate--beta-alanine ligase [Tumebacillus algifaecis]ASS75267.1 pantoate--beta-alanine ligase [Tumebacillus algifaecis]